MCIYISTIRLRIFLIAIIFCFSSTSYAALIAYKNNCATGIICVRSGMIGSKLNETWRSVGSDSGIFNIQQDWQTNEFTNWDTPHAFDQYEYSSGTRHVEHIFATDAIFMWHDTTLNKTDGETGAIDAYFRYTINLSNYGINSKSNFEIYTLSIAVDDDFEFFINGKSILRNNDFGLGTPDDFGPDHVFTKNDLSTGKAGFTATDKIEIAIHATDGSLDSPSDNFQKRILFDLKIKEIPEPSTLFLLLLGLVSLSIRPKYFKQKTGK